MQLFPQLKVRGQLINKRVNVQYTFLYFMAHGDEPQTRFFGLFTFF